MTQITYGYVNQFAESQIADTKWFYDGTLTICVITTTSGFKVVADSNVIEEAKYNKELGMKTAYDKAMTKLFDHCLFLARCVL